MTKYKDWEKTITEIGFEWEGAHVLKGEQYNFYTNGKQYIIGIKNKSLDLINSYKFYTLSEMSDFMNEKRKKPNHQ